MEKITEIYYPYQIAVPIQNSLKISLTIEKNRYKLPLTSIFDNAIRDNTKRRFLFVSKVLGKHIPILPITLQIIGRLLACAWYEDIEALALPETTELSSYLPLLTSHSSGKKSTEETYDLAALLTKLRKSGLLKSQFFLKEKTLFIGFAETATGIAQAVFNCFTNAGYIHTTREQFQNMLPQFIFNEEHSHAVEHMLYVQDKNFLKDYERIVLVDDELTTGNTARNLIKKLPGKKFGILTILDWRNIEQQERLNTIDDKAVIVSSIIKGTLDDVIEYDIPTVDRQIEFHSYDKADYNELHINEYIKGESLAMANGRFGITSDDKLILDSIMKQATPLLLNERKSGNLLCLGTEEFIYIPCLCSSMLGNDVYFHSTTRSPIISTDDEAVAYCIKNKLSFTSPYDEVRKNYVYNIPKNFYNQVFVFLEKPISDASRFMFIGMFRELGIKEVLFVYWF